MYTHPIYKWSILRVCLNEPNVYIMYCQILSHTQINYENNFKHNLDQALPEIFVSITFLLKATVMSFFSHLTLNLNFFKYSSLFFMTGLIATLMIIHACIFLPQTKNTPCKLKQTMKQIFLYTFSVRNTHATAYV